MTKVSFVTNANEGAASFRYRILAPASYLNALEGVQVTVSNRADTDADIVVFSKHWTANDQNYIRFCNLRGQKTVFDVCDDHFDTKHAEHYHLMCREAQQITCNSRAMRRVLIERGVDRSKLEVIFDPVLSARREYRKQPVRLCWFGQMMNIQGLFDVYDPSLEVPLQVAIPGKIQAPPELNRPFITWTPWHPGVIDQFAQEASVALLPYRQKKLAKSANRVLEALNCGLPVITDLIPSVKDLGTHGIFDLRDGLKSGIDFLNFNDLSEDMLLAQDQIDRLYSQKAVGEQWKQALGL